MPRKNINRPKASPKTAKAKTNQANSGPKASEEFGGVLYTSDDWKAFKKKHAGGFQAILSDLEKKDWDDGAAWYAHLEGHDKLAKITTPSGRALAKVFGDSMESWKGQTVHVTPVSYNTGWGPVIDPIEDDIDEDLLADNDEYEEVENEDDESVD